MGKCKLMGMDAVIELLQKFANNEVRIIKQPEENSNYYKMPTRQDVEIFKRSGRELY
jgi:methionyl-tRNA formyltransferase